MGKGHMDRAHERVMTFGETHIPLDLVYFAAQQLERGESDGVRRNSFRWIGHTISEHPDCFRVCPIPARAGQIIVLGLHLVSPP